MKSSITARLLTLFLLVSFVPLAILGVTGAYHNRNIARISAEASQQGMDLAAQKSSEVLKKEIETKLKHESSYLANNIDNILQRVQADCQGLADYASFLYAHPDSFGEYPFPSSYGFLLKQVYMAA